MLYVPKQVRSWSDNGAGGPCLPSPQSCSGGSGLLSSARRTALLGSASAAAIAGGGLPPELRWWELVEGRLLSDSLWLGSCEPLFRDAAVKTNAVRSMKKNLATNVAFTFLSFLLHMVV